MRLSILLAALLLANIVHAGERSVTDDTGRTVVVPDKPERIVVMHEPLLGLPLMDLGVLPVGSYGRTDDGKFATTVDFMDTVLDTGLPKPRGIGPFGQIDLEKLRALEPDLIIGTELNLDKVEQLSTVAPVYLQNVSTGKASGFSVEEDLAKVVGREDAFAKRKAAYLNHVAAVRKMLPSDPAGLDYLAVFLTDQLNAVGETSGAVQALEDLGYRRLEPGHGSRPAAQGGSTMLVPLGADAFGRLEPDLLVVMNSYMNDARDETGTRAALDRIMPGWESFLKPAREGRILFLDSAKVMTPTIASAEHALDAIEAWTKR
ncbi:ABC transporter substrate-binding protein [Phyllobacterium phragmitis]|uniref:Iron-siderophore ABC transporter substrate-binding protein n=1 Tax=Phyllobacterium phragmitis TaxID=2670329 RepID=A0ABQ0H615_9HYPH